jgi:homoserine O-acetyltransferase
MKSTKLIPLLVLLLLIPSESVLVHAQAQAQTQVAEGTQRFAKLGDLKLQSGGALHEFKVGYRTLGKLNAEKSNAILWPTWLGGTSEQLLQFIGPGKVVDSGKYFVVLVDAIGNGVTTSPSNSKTQPLMKFPQFTIRDMVEAEHRLATEVLHLMHLRAVIGVSMGGMQTFTWALAYPDFMDLVIPIMGSPQSTSYDKLLWTAQIDAIELDPAWNHGNPTGQLTRGFAISEEIGQMNITSPAYLLAHTETKDFDAYLAELKKNAKGDGGIASNQIRQRQAIMALDIPKELGVTLGEAAKKVRAKLLVIVSPQDHLVNPAPAIEFAAAVSAPVVTLSSTCGHLANSCISVGPAVARFLADPSSVRSETLQDSVNH